MRCIFSKSNDPYFNLATEEYFLKNSKEDIFFLYINKPCVVVGKHQNLMSEINLMYAIENNINIVRRISGGGTVYQDYNNINFSFIQTNFNLERSNLDINIVMIIDVLINLGLNAKLSDRHDIQIDNMKISGNAKHIYRNRVLSHGTLLFNSDLNALSLILKNNGDRYRDKSIKSVKSQVTNIKNKLFTSLNMEQFCHLIFQSVFLKNENNSILPLLDEEIEFIENLSISKFKSWDWTFGYSPQYIYIYFYKTLFYDIDFTFFVEKGIIQNVTLKNSNLSNNKIETALYSLKGCKHDYHSIQKLLNKEFNENMNHTISISEFCRYLF